MIKPVITGLCSYGLSGKVFHAPFINMHPGFRLQGVLERSKNLASADYPEIKTYRSLEEMLADDSIELVIVNTPNSTHTDFTRKALLAGKNVIVEKPFTIYSSEAEELIGIAEKKKLLLSVFQNRRFDSDFKTVTKIVMNNDLGKIHEAEFHFDRFNPELSSKMHKETGDPGTGVVYDLGSHLIDQAVFLFGMPEGVFADIRSLRPGSRVDDYMDILLYYKDLRVRLKSGYFVREPVPSFVLHGTKGSFLKSRADIQEKELMEGRKPENSSWGREPEDQQGFLHTEKDGKVFRGHITTEQGNYGDYYEGIYNALRNNARSPVTAEDGLKVITIINAAQKSQKEEKVVWF